MLTCRLAFRDRRGGLASTSLHSVSPSLSSCKCDVSFAPAWAQPFKLGLQLVFDTAILWYLCLQVACNEFLLVKPQVDDSKFTHQDSFIAIIWVAFASKQHGLSELFSFICATACQQLQGSFTDGHRIGYCIHDAGHVIALQICHGPSLTSCCNPRT